jgi:predicted RNase H-like HicB family nuclease
MDQIAFSGKQVAETVALTVNLQAFVRKDTKRRWVAVCPSLAVASQGTSAKNAMRSLEEAVEAWFESCIERGVLDQALRESNFRPLAAGEEIRSGSDDVLVDESGESDVRGDAFPISVTIPAYQAAALLASNA